MTSNAVPPSVTPPSPYEWPETIYAIQGISNASEAVITCNDYSFTSTDQGVTTVIFKQILGMLPINGLPGLIQKVISSTQFSVNIDTTFMPVYRSGGVISIVTGQPPLEKRGAQYFNTPFHNIA